ncbi:Omp28-related outer membrane protein [Flavobacterium sp. Sd200]|uniref:Omp28-related outer membrane protein n=1 Tax=Flavobacterium sp. Sd200 TaxID=2692211 RepID=UPI00136EA259|nr:Omp28-related outer membrane protein [Flavobacterium sp. Sd200]MXN91446.1 Omp28-related outer membrane protein [Flavobacterium sp. Sd200]
MKKILALLFITALVIFGCSRDYEILESSDSVILTADSSVKRTGQTITFTVRDNNGVEHTNDAVFFVDGVAIEGNTLTSEIVKTFTITAKYYNLSSESLEVSFGDGSELNFRKRLLIEDYTGTWCGYCPRVAHAINLVHTQSEDVVTVAIHRPSSNPSSIVYDPYNYDASALEATLNIPSYPKGFLNRRIVWSNPEPNNIAQAIALTQGANPKLGLALKPVVSNGNITVDVSAKFGQDFSNLKLVVYVLENGLIYEQHNYTTYFDGVDVIPDFEHNHVLRACLTPILGEEVPAAQTKLYDIYTKTFSIPAPANIANIANVEFVAFLLDQDGKAINVRKAAPGDVQEFEELQ